MGQTIVHVGPAGAGQTVKAANQLIVAGTIELVAEAIVFLEASGVPTGPALEVLAGGLAGNRILDRKAAGMVARRFTPGFRAELHDKDLGIVLAAARSAGVIMPLGAITGQLMASVKAQGMGSLDHTALLRIVEQLSGRPEPEIPD
jgi:2-hydroxy-3-oxopropionate reductase